MFRQWGAIFREFDRSKKYTSNTPIQVWITCIGMTAILELSSSQLNCTAAVPGSSSYLVGSIFLTRRELVQTDTVNLSAARYDTLAFR